MPRHIVWELMIDWDFDTVFTDESARLVAANGTLRLAAPESGISSPRGTTDQCQLTLNNADGRYSPLNTASPLYDDIKLGGAYNAPMYLRVSTNGGGDYFRVFTGVIKIPKDNPPYPGTASTVEIDCRSRDELLLNKRISTELTTFQTMHDDGYTEAEIIAQFLEDAGLSSGDYTLDAGLFVIPWAWQDDESPIEDVWSLAAACGGRFYVDPDGEFRYENMTHWLQSPHNFPVEGLDKSGYGQMDGPTYDDRELYSGVTVIASPREVLESGDLWAADATVVIPANSSKTIVAKLRQPAYAIDAASFTAVTGGGTSLDSDISIVMTKYAQRVSLVITNANATYAAELVALVITGIPVSGGPSVEEAKTSSHAFWTSFTTARPGRVRLLRGNDYVQTEGQAAALAEFLRDRFQLPRLSWRLKNVPGNPERRLGDRISVENADAMTSYREGFISAISWRLSNRGFVQDLELLDATNLYTYGNAGDDDGYFVLGTNVLGDTTGDIAHIFY